jgi:hypothetical protein
MRKENVATRTQQRAQHHLNNVYAWRDGRRWPVKAEVVAAELDRIHARDGVISASTVVEEARNPANPLHPIFGFDNPTEAAEQWWLHLARQMIRSVRVVVQDNGSLPTYVNVRISEGSRGYRPAAEVVEEPDALASAIGILASKVADAERALSDLKAIARNADPDKTGTLVALAEALATARTLATALLD